MVNWLLIVLHPKFLSPYIVVNFNYLYVDFVLQSTPSHNKTSTELDHNLNGLTLGLPAERRNGYKIPLSPGNSERTGKKKKKKKKLGVNIVSLTTVLEETVETGISYLLARCISFSISCGNFSFPPPPPKKKERKSMLPVLQCGLL